MRPITVVVADDEELVRDALADLLDSDEGFTVVGRAADAAGAVRLASEHHPDLAIVDVRMPGGGPAAAAGIRSQSSSTKIVALSAYDERWAVLAMVEAGAIGYLVKGELASKLLDMLRDLAEGQPRLAPTAASQVLDELATHLRSTQNATAKRQSQRERIQRLLDRPGELEIALQPVFDLESGGIVGVEALSRFPKWAGDDPASVFADAWETGLGVDLELLAVRRAVTTLPAVPPEAWLSVNVSPGTLLETEFADVFARQEARMVVEVTEHAAVADYTGLAVTLDPLRRAGMRLAIDDAGAGFASLRHILKLSPDLIKLDASLTSEIDENPLQRALAIGILVFADELTAGVIAEGIETTAERQTLVDLGVRLGQGYHLCRPTLPPYAWSTSGGHRVIPAAKEGSHGH